MQKKVFLEISQNSQENTCARVSFLINLPQTCNFIKKETLAQVFSCEFCEISKKTLFTEHLRESASQGKTFSDSNDKSVNKASRKILLLVRNMSFPKITMILRQCCISYHYDL